MECFVTVPNKKAGSCPRCSINTHWLIADKHPWLFQMGDSAWSESHMELPSKMTTGPPVSPETILNHSCSFFLLWWTMGFQNLWSPNLGFLDCTLNTSFKCEGTLNLMPIFMFPQTSKDASFLYPQLSSSFPALLGFPSFHCEEQILRSECAQTEMLTGDSEGQQILLSPHGPRWSQGSRRSQARDRAGGPSVLASRVKSGLWWGQWCWGITVFKIRFFMPPWEEANDEESPSAGLLFSDFRL